MREKIKYYHNKKCNCDICFYQRKIYNQIMKNRLQIENDIILNIVRNISYYGMVKIDEAMAEWKKENIKRNLK